MAQVVTVISIMSALLTNIVLIYYVDRCPKIRNFTTCNWHICFCIVREIVYFYVILIKENVHYDVKPQAFSDCLF